MRKIEKKAGFTLAELLIVIAIIAILVAIAVPIFTQQMEKARKAVDDSNLRIALSVGNANFQTGGCHVTGCDGGTACIHKGAGMHVNCGVFDINTGTIVGREKLVDGTVKIEGYNKCDMDFVELQPPGTMIIAVSQYAVVSAEGTRMEIEAVWWPLEPLLVEGRPD